MNKRELDILQRAFDVEVRDAILGGPGILQSKSRVAESLVESGHLEAAEFVIAGLPPVRVKGYRLTHLGRLEYCSNCEEQ